VTVKWLSRQANERCSSVPPDNSVVQNVLKESRNSSSTFGSDRIFPFHEQQQHYQNTVAIMLPADFRTQNFECCSGSSVTRRGTRSKLLCIKYADSLSKCLFVLSRQILSVSAALYKQADTLSKCCTYSHWSYGEFFFFLSRETLSQFGVRISLNPWHPEEGCKCVSILNTAGLLSWQLVGALKKQVITR